MDHSSPFDTINTMGPKPHRKDPPPYHNPSAPIPPPAIADLTPISGPSRPQWGQYLISTSTTNTTTTTNTSNTHPTTESLLVNPTMIMSPFPAPPFTQQLATPTTSRPSTSLFPYPHQYPQDSHTMHQQLRELQQNPSKKALLQHKKDMLLHKAIGHGDNNGDSYHNENGDEKDDLNSLFSLKPQQLVSSARANPTHAQTPLGQDFTPSPILPVIIPGQSQHCPSATNNSDSQPSHSQANQTIAETTFRPTSALPSGEVISVSHFANIPTVQNAPKLPQAQLLHQHHTSTSHFDTPLTPMTTTAFQQRQIQRAEMKRDGAYFASPLPSQANGMHSNLQQYNYNINGDNNTRLTHNTHGNAFTHQQQTLPNLAYTNTSSAQNIGSRSGFNNTGKVIYVSTYGGKQRYVPPQTGNMSNSSSELMYYDDDVHIPRKKRNYMKQSDRHRENKENLNHNSSASFNTTRHIKRPAALIALGEFHTPNIIHDGISGGPHTCSGNGNPHRRGNAAQTATFPSTNTHIPREFGDIIVNISSHDERVSNCPIPPNPAPHPHIANFSTFPMPSQSSSYLSRFVSGSNTDRISFQYGEGITYIFSSTLTTQAIDLKALATRAYTSDFRRNAKTTHKLAFTHAISQLYAAKDHIEAEIIATRYVVQNLLFLGFLHANNYLLDLRTVSSHLNNTETGKNDQNDPDSALYQQFVQQCEDHNFLITTPFPSTAEVDEVMVQISRQTTKDYLATMVAQCGDDNNIDEEPQQSEINLSTPLLLPPAEETACLSSSHSEGVFSPALLTKIKADVIIQHIYAQQELHYSKLLQSQGSHSSSSSLASLKDDYPSTYASALALTDRATKHTTQHEDTQPYFHKHLQFMSNVHVHKLNPPVLYHRKDLNAPPHFILRKLNVERQILLQQIISLQTGGVMNLHADIQPRTKATAVDDEKNGTIVNGTKKRVGNARGGGTRSSSTKKPKGNQRGGDSDTNGKDLAPTLPLTPDEAKLFLLTPVPIIRVMRQLALQHGSEYELEVPFLHEIEEKRRAQLTLQQDAPLFAGANNTDLLVQPHIPTDDEVYDAIIPTTTNPVYVENGALKLACLSCTQPIKYYRDIAAGQSCVKLCNACALRHTKYQISCSSCTSVPYNESFKKSLFCVHCKTGILIQLCGDL